jgi:hypothetical protein
MRKTEKPAQPECHTIANVCIQKIKTGKVIQLPGPPACLTGIYDYADAKDAAICTLV